MTVKLFCLFLLCIYFENVYSFASWFAEEYCETPLEVGTIIMNHDAKLSSDRNIEIYRNNQLLPNHAKYVPGETLSIVLNGNDLGEMILESNVGFYENGSCGGKRSMIATNIIIPHDYAEDIICWGGWATGHNTVWISKRFTLTGPNNQNGDPTVTSIPEEAQHIPENTKTVASNSIPPNANEILKVNPTHGQSISSNTHDNMLPPKPDKPPGGDGSRYQDQMKQRNMELKRQQQKLDIYRYSDILYEWKELHRSTQTLTVMVLVGCIVAIVFILFYYRFKINTMLTPDKRTQ